MKTVSRPDPGHGAVSRIGRARSELDNEVDREEVVEDAPGFTEGLLPAETEVEIGPPAAAEAETEGCLGLAGRVAAAEVDQIETLGVQDGRNTGDSRAPLRVVNAFAAANGMKYRFR